MVVVAEFSNPDVSKSHGVAVILKMNGTVGFRLGVSPDAAMKGGAVEFLFVVNHDAVVNDSDVGFFDQFAVRPAGVFENDIVALPFAGRFAGVDSGRLLAVHSACLAVRVGGIFKGVQNLNLKIAKHDDAAVASPLRTALDFMRRGEF